MNKILSIVAGLALGFGISQAQAGNFWDDLADSIKAGNLPPGNYQDSCRHCTVESGMLNCKCKNREGQESYTKIYVQRDCRYIENKDGILTCTAWEYERRRHHRHPGYSGGNQYSGSIQYYPAPSYPPRESVRVFLEAGPIWDQWDAERKCPNVCDEQRMYWTRHWKTTVEGQMSVCQCAR